jgi:heme O synthase-like polyprenyltransferase
MDFFFEKFFQASRARWWQVLASVCIVAVIGATVGMNGETGQPTAAHVGRCALGGGAMGLIAAVFLLWIDAGQRAREARGDMRLTLRERFMVGCLIFGFALGAFSLLCGAVMAITHVVEFLDHL